MMQCEFNPRVARERIENHSTPEPNTGCLLWFGARSHGGYGQLSVRGTRYYAHRLAYRLAHGPIPAGLDVCHRCDTPECVEPSHLFLGTPRENMQDAKSKGRLPRGDNHYSRLHPERISRGDAHYRRRHPELILRGEQLPQTKLTADKVRDIRNRYVPGNGHQLAKEFGVCFQSVNQIVRRLTWSHVA